jgi:hypothetical protein
MLPFSFVSPEASVIAEVSLISIKPFYGASQQAISRWFSSKPNYLRPGHQLLFRVFASGD